MPYVLKPNKLFAKDPNGDGYLPQNIITDRTTADMVEEIEEAGEEQIAAVEAKGEEVIESIPTDYTELSDEVDGLKSAVENDCAKNNGSYDQLTSGNAEQLLSDKGVADQVPYLFRASGGDGADRAFDKIIGGTVVWNQLVPTYSITSTYNGITRSVTAADGSLTITGTLSSNSRFAYIHVPILTDHTYLVCANNKTITKGAMMVLGDYIQMADFTSTQSHYIFKNSSYSYVRFGTSVTAGIEYDQKFIPQVYDLTQMFGSTIADYIYGLETATAGAGIALLKSWGYFTKPYYAYNPGELMSVSTSAHEMVGFNACGSALEYGNINGSGNNDGSAKGYIRTKDYIQVVPSAKYCFYASTPQQFMQLYCLEYDAAKNFIARNAVLSGGTLYTTRYGTFTLNKNTHYIRAFIYKNIAFTTTDGIDLCINLSFDGERDGEYESYVKHIYPLDDSLTLRGVPNLDVNNNLYYDGDTYESDGTVTRRYGVVTFDGSTDEGWSYYTIASSDNANNLFRIKVTDRKTATIGLNSNEIRVIANNYTIAMNQTTGRTNMTVSGSIVNIDFVNASYSSLNAWKTYLASNPITVVYPLATPTTEEADPFQSPQILDPYGTEAYIDTRTVPIPVGHSTFYPENLRNKIEELPKDFSTLIAPVEKGFKATQAYSSGALFIVNNVLYKATASIANAATITPGTNCTATTLAAVIAALA